jgi:uncharacterized protein DUF6600
MRKIRIVWCVWTIVAMLTTIGPSVRSMAQDDQDDPPTRVARLGYMEGSVSFQPAGEDDWVGAVPNRPMTTGDKLWADQDSRVELQLGSAVIRLSENTGVSFLNLDDHTVQLELSSGTVNIRVRRLNDNDDFEIDTPNLAFTALEPGNYRLNASEDGAYTGITIRAGDGDATGNGQSYSLHAGQYATFSGTDSLSADIEPIESPDPFDAWADARERRYDDSRSAQYLSRDVVGFDDLDDNGDWRDQPEYGHVWFPRVEAGWAPYHEGHWDWIDPWGYTWVDDSSWGYAPFHYGRWVFVSNRWGWIAGPPAVEPVYAPALVVFIGGGGGWGGNIGWFPLGPREVYVPSYPVGRAYMTQINVSNTVVNTTVITNVYNTTIINKSTTITNVTYANRNVAGAVTAVPQNAFASAQPVGRAAVKVSAQQISAAPMITHAAVVPTRAAVLGAKASTAGQVTAPPAAVMNRQVVAKKTPPPPPPSFAARQQAMAAHPGQPATRQQLASLRPAAAARPAVRVAPPAKPATPTTGHPMNARRPGQPAPPAAQPANRPGQPPANANGRPTANQPQPNRPSTTQPNRPPAAETNRPTAAQPNRPPSAQPGNRPEANRPTEAPAHPAPAPNNRPEANRPPAQPTRPPSEPSNRPEASRPTEAPAHPAPAPNNRPEANRPTENRPPAAQPSRPAPNRQPPPKQAVPAERPPQHAAPPPAKPAPKPQKPEDKKEEEKKPPGE